MKQIGIEQVEQLSSKLENLNSAISINDNSIIELNTVVSGKQDTLIAGNNITIENNIISASDSKNLIFSNKVASTWVSDSTYSDYGYKCDISCSGVTSSMVATVMFAQTEAESGDYATVCETGNGIVTIYSKVNTSITIPTIVVMGA
mgnify:CR=1 FL=1